MTDETKTRKDCQFAHRKVHAQIEKLQTQINALTLKDASDADADTQREALEKTVDALLEFVAEERDILVRAATSQPEVFYNEWIGR